jgi:thiamine pyrophosphokinase
VDTVVVLAGGPATVPVELPEAAYVIAADGGAELAPARVDLAVGDFDSISPETLASLANVERHPAAKNATDLELALDAALRAQPRRVLVVGSEGGRLDHLLGSLLLLASERYAGVRLDAQLGEAAVHVIRDERTLVGEPGELVSLFALHGPARGVTARGFRWPLEDATLEPGASLGTSNELAAREASVSVAAGVVVAVRPNGSAWAGTSS